MKEFWNKNKATILKSMLIVLPVLAVGLATAGDSVQVFDAVNKTYSYGSFFVPVPVESLAILPPLAGASALFLFIESAYYMVKKKEKALTACKFACIVGALCASVPPMIRGGEMLVLPNQLFPIFLLVDLLFVIQEQKKLEKSKALEEVNTKKKNKKKK